MSNTHNADEICPIIEKHYLGKNVKVWFATTVVKVLKTSQSRSGLVLALFEEVEKIPAEYIPYGVCHFKEMIFLYRSLWVQKEGQLLIEVELPDEVKKIGEIEMPLDALEEVEEEQNISIQ